VTVTEVRPLSTTFGCAVDVTGASNEYIPTLVPATAAIVVCKNASKFPLEATKHVNEVSANQANVAHVVVVSRAVAV
jgi:hypothetical protein